MADQQQPQPVIEQSVAETVEPKANPLAEEEYSELPESGSIIVKNIGPSTDPENPLTKQLADFFSFCGNITALSLVPDESDGSVSAFVTFENTSAARTALLLNHTFLNERSITVELAPVNLSATPEPSVADFPRNYPVPESRTSVIQNLLDQGYQLGVGALEAATAYDEEHKISSQMNSFAKEIETKVNEIDNEYNISAKVNEVVGQVNALDQQYGISLTVNSAVLQASAQVVAIDQQYQISQKAKEAVETASSQVVALDQQYRISENVVAGAEHVASESVRILNTVSEELQLPQRTKDAQEAITLGAAQISQFLETNETVQEIGSFFTNTIGSALGSLWGSTTETNKPEEEIESVPLHVTSEQPEVKEMN